MSRRPDYTGQTYTMADGAEVGYIVDATGYVIYRNWKPWISQHEPNIPDSRISYEENAIAQIEAIRAAEQQSEETVSQQDRIEQTVAMILANQMMEV